MENKWIMIFKTGTHAPRGGTPKYYSQSDLDQIVERYDPKISEAPVVIGNPDTADPAYGWVSALKREGDLLLAKFKQVAPAFVEMFNRGDFKKQSIAFMPGNILRHVGFLGAKPPMIPALKEVFGFSGPDGACFYFDNHGNPGGLFSDPRSGRDNEFASESFYSWRGLTKYV